MDTRRMRSLMTGLPQQPAGQPGPPPDPEISADYTPQTLRVTRGDAGASGPVGLLTATSEPSWLYEVFDLQTQLASWNPSQPKPEARMVRSDGDRLWLFWRRSAGTVGGGPALYYKTLRPGIKVRRGRFINPNTITVRSRPDLVTGAMGGPTPIAYTDIDMSEGAIYFREEDEGLVALHGVPVLVDVTYTDPLNPAAQITERHSITWREEIGETPVPLDVSINEGSLSVFPVYERTMMHQAPNGPLVAVEHLQKMWLFWSSTRGSGNDIFQATLAPRFKPDAQLYDQRFGLTALRGKP
jgi:hypothetical protein